MEVCQTRFFVCSEATFEKGEPGLQGNQIGLQSVRQVGGCLLWPVFESYRSVPIFGLLFYTVKVMHNCCQEMGWDTFWSVVFTNSSGRPASLALFSCH
jgi:hypothetical protein